MRTFILSFILVFFVSISSFAGGIGVKWVYDGDTILLTNGLKVRYIGINAPEIAHKDKRSEFFGYEAKRKNIELVKGRKVILRYDVERKDRYGRILAYVFLENGTFVNAELLKQGFAHCLAIKPNIRHSRFFLKLQKVAIKKRAGMWKYLKDTKGFYKGNRNSFRFHKKNCESTIRMKNRNTVIFSSRKEAFMHGYAPCRECNP